MSAVLSRPITGWAQDVRRGLDHPASVAARRQRIAAADKAAACRAETMNLALGLLESVALKPKDTARVLRALANSMRPQVGDNTRTQLAELADEIEGENHA